MLVIGIRFLAGTYHATPWDRQVNEGDVEWPPSPWRLLRALLFTWYYKASDEVSEEVLRGLVEKLSKPPKYHIPQATLGHTRHYMPLYRSSIDGKTAKVFDAFARISPGKELYVIWPELSLLNEERAALGILLTRMGYLGRAESWIEAWLADEPGGEVNSYPIEAGEHLPEGCDGVRLIACTPPNEYLEWRAKTVEDMKERRLSRMRTGGREKGKPMDKVKLGGKDIEKIGMSVPVDLFQALHADTGELKSAGWSQPPGSRWVIYARPRDIFAIVPRSEPESAERTGGTPTIARFAVASQVPPRLTDAVSLAEKIHDSLVSISEGSGVFIGLDEHGKPLKGHGHSYIICESNLAQRKGRRGEITHVTVYAKMGLGLRERKALNKLTRVWGHGGHDIQLVLLGIGRPEDFTGTGPVMGDCPLFAMSRTWLSRTPFVPTRHLKSTRAGKPKTDGSGLHIGSPAHDLRRLLGLAGFPPPVSVEPCHSTDLGGHETRWLHFRQQRKGGGGRMGTRTGCGFRIEFPTPVRGPVAVGYGAHFGLGLFVPTSPEDLLEGKKETALK